MYVRALGLFVDLKNMGTIFWSSWPFEKMPLLYFDYVKTADFGSEKKSSITIWWLETTPNASNALFEWFRCKIKGAR